MNELLIFEIESAFSLRVEAGYLKEETFGTLPSETRFGVYDIFYDEYAKPYLGVYCVHEGEGYELVIEADKVIWE